MYTKEKPLFVGGASKLAWQRRKECGNLQPSSETGQGFGGKIQSSARLDTGSAYSTAYSGVSVDRSAANLAYAAGHETFHFSGPVSC